MPGQGVSKLQKNSPADASTGVIFISPARVNLISSKGVSPACPKGSITRAFSIKRGFSYTELTEEQHRAALEATFANGPIKKYRNLIPALMENYAATVGFKRCYSIITELKKFLSYKRMIVKDDRLKAYVYNSDFYY